MMLGSTILSFLIGMGMRLFKSHYNVFIIIHRLLFLTIAVGAYIHGANMVLYIGVSAVLFEAVLRILFTFVNKNKLKNPKFETIGEHYTKISF